MDRSEAWGAVLIAAALLSLGLQVMHLRRGRITAMQAGTGMIARGGFLLLGVIYVTGLVERWPGAPLFGLAVVGIGIFLHLAAGILQNLRSGGE
ncbi:MAG: hypothetical protein WEF86_14810 [Gemmatimonadota bacterium]